jgi:hypothetical protein
VELAAKAMNYTQINSPMLRVLRDLVSEPQIALSSPNSAFPPHSVIVDSCITAANQPQMNVLTLIDELASSIKMVSLTLDQTELHVLDRGNII